MLHEETSQPKASGISSEARRPHPNSEPHSQSLCIQIQKRNLQGSKVHGNQVDIQDFRGNISMVHITHVKNTTLTDEVADDYLQLCNEGRFPKKCVPRGYIPDLHWTTIHNDPDQPIKPVKQNEDPNKTTAAPAAPTEIEGPPSSHLRSKTKQHSTTIKQEQLECNQPSLDPAECNQAKLEVNQVEVDTGNRNSLVHYALTLLGVAKTISDQL